MLPACWSWERISFFSKKKKLLQAIKFESNRVTELSENCQTPSRLSKIHRVNEEDARSTKFHRIVASNNSTIAPRDKTSRRKGHKAAESRNDLYLRYGWRFHPSKGTHRERKREINRRLSSIVFGARGSRWGPDDARQKGWTEWGGKKRKARFFPITIAYRHKS